MVDNSGIVLQFYNITATASGSSPIRIAAIVAIDEEEFVHPFMVFRFLTVFQALLSAKKVRGETNIHLGYKVLLPAVLKQVL